jgi:N6-L-threonylcarbamoyladenine synthase
VTSSISRPLVLGLETSCDETSAAVLDGENRILGHVILSQDVHEVFGGVVPELAARAHLQNVDSVVGEALSRADITLDDIDVFGVTAGPGLIGALLVGVCWTKATAWALDRPWVAVHHMEGHLFGPVLEEAEAEPPFIALLVSGGHTLLLHATAWGEYELLGHTRDDAAGEAFDKVAKLLGLPYPGGPAIQNIAIEGDPARYRLPRPMLRRNQTVDDPAYYDFSFSGLKTAVVELTRDLGDRVDDEVPHVAAAFQAAAVDVLVTKTLRAVRETGCGRIVLGGGVSANTLLRSEMSRRLDKLDADTGPRVVHHASLRLSLDNGAMIARAARFRFDQGERAGFDQNASASLLFPGLRTGSRTAASSRT